LTSIFSYRTLAIPSEGNFHDSGSKFLGYAFPSDSRTDVEAHLAIVKAAHPKARHHCYAYRVLEREEITEYASDAGEPSGSAGAPMLGELKRRELLNICVVVVRYFGGTKLGIPGLIHAYRETTAHTIDAGVVSTHQRMVNYKIEMPIALQPMFYNTCKLMDITIVDTQYTECFKASVTLPLDGATQTLSDFISGIAGKSGDPEVLMEHLGIKLSQLSG
jgi:uncharacterized YigZ family protein